MRTIRCQICKDFFEYEGLPPSCCSKCKLEKDERYRLVRDVVKNSPGITPLRVHEQTGVPLSVIMQYVEDGGLSVVPSKTDADEIDLEEFEKLVLKAGKR